MYGIVQSAFVEMDEAMLPASDGFAFLLEHGILFSLLDARSCCIMAGINKNVRNLFLALLFDVDMACGAAEAHKGTTCLYKAVKRSNFSFVRVACRIGGHKFVSMRYENMHSDPLQTILWTAVENFDPKASEWRQQRMNILFDLLVDCGGDGLVLRKDSSGQNVLVAAMAKKWWHAVEKLIHTVPRVVMTTRHKQVLSCRKWDTYKKILKARNLWPVLDQEDSTEELGT